MRPPNRSRRPLVDVENWCAAFRARCRERGVRVTPQRLAVYRALAEDLSHPTADVVHGRLADDLPSLSLATVYRILESLEREGMVRRISTPNGAGRFDANMAAHQHLECRVCRRVMDLSAPALQRVAVPDGLPAGFAAEELDIRVVGVCSTCRKKKTN